MCAGTMPSRGGQRAHRCLTRWHRARSGRIEDTKEFVRLPGGWLAGSRGLGLAILWLPLASGQ